jgi:hypothetical protein
VKSVGDGWAASCPLLEKYGAFTLGASEEVLNEMHRAAQWIVEALWLGRKDPYPTNQQGRSSFLPPTIS